MLTIESKMTGMIMNDNGLRQISHLNFRGKSFIFRKTCAQIFGHPNEFKFSAQILGAQIYWAQYNGTQIFGK